MAFDRTKPPSTQPLETVKPKRADQTLTPGQKTAFTPMPPEQLKGARDRFDRDTALLQSKSSALDSTQDQTTNQNAKTSDSIWTRSFNGKTGNDIVDVRLTREKNGVLDGFYQLNQNVKVELQGKILESADNDLFLEGTDGSKWHGKYTETNSLLFGDVALPRQTLKSLELKPNVVITQKPTGPINPAKTSSQAWKKNFTAQQGKDKLSLELTRSVEGTLTGVCSLNGQNFELEGKLLQDDDVYLEAKNGTIFHGRFTNTDTLLFGNIHLPAVGKVVARDLKSVEFKMSSESVPVAKTDDLKRVIKPWEASDWGVQFIADHEKFEPNFYDDAAHKCTIGYGHKVHEKPKGQNKDAEAPFVNGITKEEAKELLKKDVQIAVESINSNVTVPLDQRTFDVLVSFVFNSGKNGFADSDLLKRLNTGDYNSLAIELRRWTGAKQSKTKEKSFSAGLYNRRQAEIDSLPADDLDRHMKLSSYTSTYTAEQITKARDLITKLKDKSEREVLFGLLQSKIPYHSQRDNAQKQETADAMCNLTSLAMALETIGISNPDPKRYPQYEDYLEHYGQTQIANFDRTMPDKRGWRGVAEGVGAKVSFLDAPNTTYEKHKQEWWTENALPVLRSGNAIILSIFGHIVRLQDVVLGGLVVDDPFGARLKMASAPSATNYTWGKGLDGENNRNAETIDAPEAKRSKGNDNVWDWSMVEKRSMHWIAVIEPGGSKT
jgi:GH24 family phage-related lysozyme (muramidase)